MSSVGRRPDAVDGRFRPGLAASSFKRFKKRGLFSTDISACAFENFGRVKPASNISPKVPSLRLQLLFQVADRLMILTPDDIAFVRADCAAGDDMASTWSGHLRDQPVPRSCQVRLLQRYRRWFALVLARPSGLPFESCRKAGVAAASGRNL